MACWFSLNIFLPTTIDVFIILESIKDQTRLPFFMKIIITMCWAIWIMHNDIVFNNFAHSVERCKAIFVALVILRAKATYHPLIDLWLESFM